MHKCTEYKNSVNSYIRHYTDKNYKNDSSYHDLPMGYFLMEIKTIDEKITDPEVKEMIMKDMIMNVVNYEDITEADSILNIFYSRCTDTAYNTTVKKKVEAWKNRKRTTFSQLDLCRQGWPYDFIRRFQRNMYI